MRKYSEKRMAVVRWLICLCVCGGIGLGSARGEVFIWTNAADGLWSEAANWSGGVVPNLESSEVGATHEVVIDALGEPYTVQVDDGLLLALDNLILDSPDLTLELIGHLKVGQNLELRAGTMRVRGYHNDLVDATLTGDGGEVVFEPVNIMHMHNLVLDRDIRVNRGDVHLNGQWREGSVVTIQDSKFTFYGNRAPYREEDIGEVQLLGNGLFALGGVLDNTDRRFAPEALSHGWMLSGEIQGGVIGPFPVGEMLHVDMRTCLTNTATMNGVVVEGEVFVESGTQLELVNGWDIVEGGWIGGDGSLILNGGFHSSILNRISSSLRIQMNDNEIDNRGGVMTLGAQRWYLGGGVIRGGVIRSVNEPGVMYDFDIHGTLDGVRLDADVQVDTYRDDLEIINGLSVGEGRVIDFRDAHLVMEGDQRIWGGGFLFLNNVDTPSGQLVLEVDSQLGGSRYPGRVGSSGGSIVNRGAMEWTRGVGQMQFYSDLFVNEGTIESNWEVYSPESLSFGGSFLNAGQIDLDDPVALRFRKGFTQTTGLTRISTGVIEIDPGYAMHIDGGRFEGYTLDIHGDVVNAAGIVDPITLSQYDHGTIAIDGDYTQGPDGTLVLDLSRISTLSRSQDQLKITGHASLGGTLKLSWAGDWRGYDGVLYPVLLYGSSEGEFDRFESSNASVNAWIPHYKEDGLYLEYAIPGDFDLNGQVDVMDLSRWAVGFGSEVGFSDGFSQGDANQDGQVDVLDLSFWAVNFGGDSVEALSAYSFVESSAAQAIPEPGSFGLLCLGGLGLLRRRR